MITELSINNKNWCEAYKLKFEGEIPEYMYKQIGSFIARVELEAYKKGTRQGKNIRFMKEFLGESVRYL